MAGVEQVVYLQRDPDMRDIGFNMSKVAYQQLEIKARHVPACALNLRLAHEVESAFHQKCRRGKSRMKVPEFLCWDLCHKLFKELPVCQLGVVDEMDERTADAHTHAIRFLKDCIAVRRNTHTK